MCLGVADGRRIRVAHTPRNKTATLFRCVQSPGSEHSPGAATMSSSSILQSPGSYRARVPCLACLRASNRLPDHRTSERPRRQGSQSHLAARLVGAVFTENASLADRRGNAQPRPFSGIGRKFGPARCRFGLCIGGLDQPGFRGTALCRVTVID